jgi:serine/threonine-protein kinase RsbW
MGSNRNRLVTVKDRSTLSWKRFQLRTIEDKVAFLDALLNELMSDSPAAERDIFAVHMAMEEAVSNALRHGNQGDPKRGVRVCYFLDDTFFLTKVEDEGAGFSPLATPAPTLPENIERESGRGLMLMRHFMTCVRLNKAGNRVTMYKCWSSEGKES